MTCPFQFYEEKKHKLERERHTRKPSSTLLYFLCSLSVKITLSCLLSSPLLFSHQPTNQPPLHHTLLFPSLSLLYYQFFNYSSNLLTITIINMR
ncbi:hypothetical protein RIF29_08138 [Crotalaria pallida]|uniref:Uncharacterized protein n=1 Tax=Crotalaria pallida TaxID=3830 RepID=A0AAN9J4Z7_CROPI